MSPRQLRQKLCKDHAGVGLELSTAFLRLLHWFTAFPKFWKKAKKGRKRRRKDESLVSSVAVMCEAPGRDGGAGSQEKRDWSPVAKSWLCSGARQLL